MKTISIWCINLSVHEKGLLGGGGHSVPLVWSTSPPLSPVAPNKSEVLHQNTYKPALTPAESLCLQQLQFSRFDVVRTASCSHGAAIRFCRRRDSTLVHWQDKHWQPVAVADASPSNQ